MTHLPGGPAVDSEAGLAESLHRVLATLVRLQGGGDPLPPDLLRERLELVRWLRGELAAAEELLAAEYDRLRRAGVSAAG